MDSQIDQGYDEKTSLLTVNESEMSSKKTVSSRQINSDEVGGRFGLYALVALLQAIGLVSIILVIVLTKKYLGGYAWDGTGMMFNWHPVFMTVGLVFLYGNAAIVYRVFHRTNKFRVKLLHGGLNLSAFIFTVLGTVAVFGFHNKKGIPNMYSMHSWIGMGTIVLYACQLLFGFLGFLYPKFSDNGRRLYLNIHVYFGAILLGTVLAAVLSGVTEKMLFSFKLIYPDFKPVGIVANSYGIAVAMFVMIVAFILHHRPWKRIDP